MDENDLRERRILSRVYPHSDDPELSHQESRAQQMQCPVCDVHHTRYTRCPHAHTFETYQRAWQPSDYEGQWNLGLELDKVYHVITNELGQPVLVADSAGYPVDDATFQDVAMRFTTGSK